MLDLYDLGDRQVTQLKVALGKIDERIARLATAEGARSTAPSPNWRMRAR